MEKVSIIIPVYNVAGSLERCVRSLMRQTYENVEILLVDDGSTDDSGKLADELKKEDERIRVIHKKNEGVTSARKVGWLMSKGMYCMFIDADDFIESDSISFFVNTFNHRTVDFVTGWRDMVYEDGHREYSECPFVVGEYNTAEYIKMCLDKINNLPTIWIGMFKRSVFNDKVFDISPTFFRGDCNRSIKSSE